MNKTPKVIFCSASVGSGHIRAAQAVATLIKNSKTIDILDCIPRWFGLIYRDGYFFATKKFPWLVGFCYRMIDIPLHKQGLMHRIGCVGEDFISRSFQKRVTAMVDEMGADAVISTHFFTSGILARMRRRGELNVPLITVVTDDHPHSIWLETGSDAICVSSETAMAAAIKRGADKSIVRVTGIPIDPAFKRSRARKAQKPVILICGGGNGMGKIVDLVQVLFKTRFSQFRKIIVVCGKNKRLKRSLEKLNFGRLQVIGYTDSMHTLMAESDILISKPGGLTTTEAVASGLPMVLMRPIPGQEECNAKVLVDSNVAMIGYDTKQVITLVSMLLENPDLLKKMRAATTKLSVTNSARNVVEQIKSVVLVGTP